MQDKLVAFIGLGNMGGPMAANLVRAGYRVAGFDPVPAALEAAQANGLEPASSAAAAVADADIVFTMLPNAEVVRAVWSELVPAARKGALLVDCSTIDVDAARAVHDMASEQGLRSVDAPVSGGVAGAVAGALTFMAGGTEDDFAEVEPLLAVMGRKVVHCGGPGTGQAAKICNNMILGINIVAVSEAFNLAEKLGLSHEALFDVASTSSGQCWALTSYCPVPGLVEGTPSNNDYRPGAAATMLFKDLSLAQDAAESVAAKTPLGKHATEIYEDFIASGHGGEDFSAIIRYLR